MARLGRARGEAGGVAESCAEGVAARTVLCVVEEATEDLAGSATAFTEGAVEWVVAEVISRTDVPGKGRS